MTAAPLVRACHPGPTVAVTAIAGLLCVGSGLGVGGAGAVVVAVLAGQLVIGWSNDLADAPRDRAVGRADKPIASGELEESTLRRALLVASCVCVVGSLALGPPAALVHLVLVVGSGLAYNLRLKATALSWLPYALAFGALPAVVSAAAFALPDASQCLAGALLGVGAHVVNVLPDLDDDAATGVRGWPHRLGARGARVVAPVLLGTASVVAVVGAPGRPSALAVGVLALVLAVAVAGAVAGGRSAFRAAVAVALADVVLLVAVRSGVL